MEKEIGKKIKYYRLKMNLTQSELAEGVISTSYLSKIENGNAEPPIEIVELLSKKLNIESLSEENDKIIEICKQWFELLLFGDKEKATNLYKMVNEYTDYIIHTDIFHLLELHKLRYYLIINNKGKAVEQFSFLSKFSKKFIGNETYYWLKLSGNYYYFLHSYNEAFSYYQESEKELGRELLFRECEEADLYYSIALTASKLKKVYICNLYGKKALDYYQRTYNLKRCVECHLLLGISYQRMSLKDKAMESFQLATEISKTLDDAELLAICYQNIGELYSSINHTELALEFFTKSYDLRKNNTLEKIIVPVLSLVKEYYKINDKTNAKRWMKEGFLLTELQHQIDPIFIYELKIFQCLIDGPDDSLQYLITKKVLPYLERKKMYYEKYLYLNILGDYYFNNKKYKSAALCYQYGNNSINNLIEED